MSLNYVTLTELAEDGSAANLNGTATFTPNQAVYSAANLLLVANVPVQAQVIGGQLKTASGGALQLLATDNAGLTFTSLTGYLEWSVQLTLGGAEQPAWSFFLSSAPSTRDLFSLANTQASGGGVSSVTAADASIVVGGTATAPTVRTGTLDVIAALHPPAAAVAVNGQKVTSIANGSAATDAAAFGQLPSASSPLGTAAGGSGASYGTLALLLAALLAAGGGTMGAELAPKVVALTDAATVVVNAALGNDFRVQLGGNRTIGVPGNPTDGQRITVHVQQPASGGPFTPTFSNATGGYDFGTAGAPTWSTAASAIDVAGFLYRSDVNKWLFTGAALGN